MSCICLILYQSAPHVRVEAFLYSPSFFTYCFFKNAFYIYMVSYTSLPVWKTTSPRWCHLWTLQARLPWQPPFSQHVLWWCCNPLGIPSFTAEILLFNSVFHDGVAPVSVSTLKPPLGVIGVLPLKPRVSPITSVCI